MLTATPAYVVVHYLRDGNPTFMTGYMHADQDDGSIALVISRDAWQLPHVCCWRMALVCVTRVEVIDSPYEPTIMEQILDGLVLTDRQRLVYDAIRVSPGGMLQWTDVRHVLDDDGHALTDGQVADALQSLKAMGRITLVNSTDTSSGVVITV